MKEFNKLKEKIIAHITTAHQWDDVRIFHREAKLLVPYFSKVYVIAPLCKEKIVDGVHFISWGDFRPLKRLERIKAVNKIKKVLNEFEADVFHIHDPELLIGLPEYVKKRKKNLIYDVHEYYYGTLYENSGGGIKGFLLANMYTVFERSKIKYIDGVVTVSPQLYDYYKRFSKKVAMLRNFPDVKNIIKLTGEKGPNFKSYNLLYSGSLEQKALFPLANAIKSLKEKYKEIKVTIVGDFKDQEFKELLFKEWNNLKVGERLIHISRMERDEFLKSLTNYSLGLVLFYPSKNAEVGLPNKLFEYMAARLPVVVPDLPNQKEIVLKHRCGSYCNTSDPLSIERAIDEILSDESKALEMGVKGREACINQFNSEKELEKLLNLYEEVLE